ncbi:hypothetical protein BpHYR1_053849 [Brachionus plicatilis]|uniref:Uncharacterized protein n=1 Tax=Brachionus plicatilis TaxID=10195 RepID=A0A3M7Q5I7_BRAPC|nr:hypothetical protein BpHYR1_053849 [Brachionus plicatilis]
MILNCSKSCSTNKTKCSKFCFINCGSLQNLCEFAKIKNYLENLKIKLKEYPAILIKRKKPIEKNQISNARNQFVNSEYDINQNDCSKFEPSKSMIDNFYEKTFKLKDVISTKKNFKIFQSNNQNNIIVNLSNECDSSSIFYTSDCEYSIDSLDLILNDEQINALVDKRLIKDKRLMPFKIEYIEKIKLAIKLSNKMRKSFFILFIAIYFFISIGTTNAIRCIACDTCLGSSSANIDDPRIIDCDYYCYKITYLSGTISKGCSSGCTSGTLANGDKTISFSSIFLFKNKI